MCIRDRLPGAVGLMQATEVIKLVLGEGLPMIGRLLLYDAMKMSFREVKVRRNPDCELCGEHPSVKELIDYQAFCNVLQGVEEAEEFDGSAYEMTPQALKRLLDSDEQPVLLDVREPYEWDICRIEGAELMPLSSFKADQTGIATDTPIVLYCYKGVRSMSALQELKKAGFSKLNNLEGGIDRWALEVDTDMPRY